MKINKGCVPRNKYDHDCAQYTSKSSCTSGEHEQLCKWSGSSCSHMCNGLHVKACQKTNWRELDCLSMLKEHLTDITGQNEEFEQEIKTFDIDQTLDYEVFGGMSFDQYLDQMLKPVAERMVKVRNLKYLFEEH